MQCKYVLHNINWVFSSRFLDLVPLSKFLATLLHNWKAAFMNHDMILQCMRKKSLNLETRRKCIHETKSFLGHERWTRLHRKLQSKKLGWYKWFLLLTVFENLQKKTHFNQKYKVYKTGRVLVTVSWWMGRTLVTHNKNKMARKFNRIWKWDFWL